MLLIFVFILCHAGASVIDLSLQDWTVRCSTSNEQPIPPGLNSTKMAIYLKLVQFTIE